MDDLRQELAELRARVIEQQQQISELKSAVAKDKETETARDDGHPTRRGVLAGVAAAVAGGAVLTSASPAEAADLVLGSTSNTATLATGLAFTGDASGSYGIGVTDHGLDSFNKSAAIAGHTQGNFECAVLGYDTSAEGRYAVYGQTNVAGVAVLGLGISPLSKGVVGVGGSRGLIGQCEGSGAKSIGVLALASQPDATALAVNGVFRARRAGRATVPAGIKTKVVPISPLTDTSLVVATAQKVAGSVAVQAVTVKTTSPKSFTIRLNQNAPAGGMSVAWVVIDTIGSALS
jgi:hypothetical protein